MQDKGLSKEVVIAELKRFLQQDQNYNDGRILCSMCTLPSSLAKKAHEMFLNSNLGDSGLFCGSAKLEKEVIDDLAELLNGKGSTGFLVSGGTEANLLAMLAARNMAQVKKPEIILPESVHFSFNKICSMLSVKPVFVGLDDYFRVNCFAVENLVNENTIAIVGSVGTSELGVVDPIGRLSKIAKTHSLWLHVDAAFGGLILPFLQDQNEVFDFRLSIVQSVTVDPHKMGLATVPAGAILFRNKKALDWIKTETPYLTTDSQHTFIGTRTGASAAATWAVFRSLGKEGFRRNVANCMRTTMFLKKGIENLGLTLLVEPTLNILAFHAKKTKLLAEKLQASGWFVSYVPRYDCIRLVVMPHIKRRHALSFLEDLSKIMNSV